MAIARLKRGRRPAIEEALKMSCSRGCAPLKLWRRCCCFCHFGWRGQLPSSTLPPWPRMKLSAMHGRQYSQTEFALNASIRAQAVVVPGSAALVTTPLRSAVTRASCASTPTPGLQPVMAVEQTEWFEPWLQWNHSQNEKQERRWHFKPEAHSRKQASGCGGGATLSQVMEWTHPSSQRHFDSSNWRRQP